MAAADSGTSAGPKAGRPADELEAKVSATRGRLKESARSTGALAEKRGRLKQAAVTLRAFVRGRWRRARGVQGGNEGAE